MLFSLRRRFSLWNFNRAVRPVLDTRPVICSPDATVTVVSQLHPPDVMMYLVAIKTFARFVPVRTVVVVGDGLSHNDKSLIRRHVEPVEFLDTRTIDTHGMPRGGTWERLITIVDRSALSYTIQLDADTITQAEPREVIECVASNRSFTLGTGMGRAIVPVDEASAVVQHLASPQAHIQIAAEIAMRQLSHRPAFYVRGNSAFTGFARGAHNMQTLRGFSAEMSALLGERRWREWGSEQVASNYMIANSADPYVLPFERYGYYRPGGKFDVCPFVHFMGTYRFAHGAYRRAARAMIESQLAS